MKNVIFCISCVCVFSQSLAVQQLSLPYTCTTTICQPGKDGSVSSEVRYTQSQQGPPGKRGVIGPKGDKGDPCHCDIVDQQAIENLRNEWNSKTNEYNDIIERLERLENITKNLSNSVQEMQPSQNQEDKGLSDFSPGKDGWIVIQRRQDGSVDFYRDWESYAKGFGNRQGEFWLGLRNIHKLTTTKSCKLRIDMTGWDGTKHHAEYTTFRIANEESKFRLTISGYTGNPLDALKYHNGRPFSTIDRDNDAHSSLHCAQRNTGPWWHGACHHSNLNGGYCKSGAANSNTVWWNGISSCLRFVEMKILCS